MKSKQTTTAQEGDGRQNSLPRLTYKISEAAQILGISSMSIRRLISCKTFKVIKRLRIVLIPGAELERYARSAR